jgi:hypothetical protein
VSSDLLRRAAAKLRERAEWFGTTSPWRVEYAEGGYPQRIVDDGAVLYAETFDGLRGTPGEAGTAEYIALVHPPVALALARLFDVHATLLEVDREAGEFFTSAFAAEELVAIAREILREPARPTGEVRSA